MKIRCLCGHTIFDQTDYLPYKARFIADQDREDMREAIDARISLLIEQVRENANNEKAVDELTQHVMNAVHGAIIKYSRLIYQCTNCGRLFVDDIQYHSQIFVPKDESVPHNLLRSKEGEKWKRPLRGQWRSSEHKGDVFWGGGVEDSGFELFDKWEDVERKYFEVFSRLKANAVLRGASLSKDGETIHRWPQESG